MFLEYSRIMTASTLLHNSRLCYPIAQWIDLGNCNPKLTSLIASETFHMMKVIIKMQHMDIALHFILFMFDKRFLSPS